MAQQTGDPVITAGRFRVPHQDYQESSTSFARAMEMVDGTGERGLMLVFS